MYQAIRKRFLIQTNKTMTAKAKQTVRNYFKTEYGKEMLEIYGLKIVKKEIFHAIKNQDGDNRAYIYLG